MKNCFLLITLVAFIGFSQDAEKVGVVLSGGGAKAFAHVGVLKALEEKGIKIDYIVGTSGGALIGGLYAAGYTPEQIEELVTSDQFYRLAKGELSRQETYFFYQDEKNSSFLDLKFNIDSNMLRNIPSNLVNPSGINYYLFEKLIGASNVSGNNFDSLMIPFRCVASDILNKKPVVFSKGEVHNTIRASMSFPMYLNPVNINGVIYVDGGLYQNYPIAPMVKEFHPDIIFGCNVGSADEMPNEDDALNLITVMSSQRDTNTYCADRQYTVHPETSIGTFDFDKVHVAIDSGYAYTMRLLDSLKYQGEGGIAINRLEFLDKISPLNISELEVAGVTDEQAQYIKSVLIKKKFNDGYSLKEFRKRYYTLLNSSYVRRMRLSYELMDGGNIKVIVYVVPEKAFQASFGGFFSSRPVNMAYIGAQYQFLGKIPFAVRANAYFGKYYGSVMTEFQANWPVFTGLSSRLSFYMNRVDYYDSYSTFFEESKPSYIIDEDIHIEFQNELYLYGKGIFNFSIGYGQKNDDYFETVSFQLTDTMTNTRYSALRVGAGLEHNGLNRPQFASEGVRLAVGMAYHNGNEVTKYGTTDPRDGIEYHRVELINLQLKYEHYLYGSKYYSVGIYGEFNYAFRDFFLTYVENLINVPTFAPVPELGTFFIPRYRNDRYVGAGLINVISYKGKADLRLEGYFYQAIQTLESNENNSAVYSDYFTTWGLQATASAIYHSFIGPIRFSSSYVLGAQSPWIFQLSIGYLFYNKRFMQTLY